jgi:hypothetical protein
MYLIIQHFTNPTYEGLAKASVCSKDEDEDDLTYQNRATIEQQQKELDDFKKNIEGRLSELQTKVKGFKTRIKKNGTSVAANASHIQSTVKDVNNAKNQKAKELDALSI